MKKISLLSVSILSLFNIFAQDIITKKNGDDIKAKVLEVSQNDIKYKKFDSPNGPTYVITKSDLILVRFEDGTKEIFSDNKNITVISGSDDDMARQGRIDASNNYKGKNSGSGWTGATVVLTSPLIGLIPAVACSTTEPSEDNLNYKNKELMNNDSYRKAYQEQAHKIKKRKVWTGYGIGAAIWALFIVILTSAGG